MENKWDSRHKSYTIYNWKKSGLICREGETYDDIYDHVMSITHCELCSVEFNDEVYNEKRCMDHDHKTNYFRQVLCQKCNKRFDLSINQTNKTGHRWICHNITKNKLGNISVGFRYSRKGFKRKGSISLTKLICLSFINMIKKPI